MGDWVSAEAFADCIKLHYYRTGKEHAGGDRTGGGTISGDRTGGAKATIVLCHGMTDDGLCWTPVAQALEADYDVIMLDARGHGLSDAPPAGYDARQMALDLAGFIQALHLKKPILMGHSMGARTVFQTAVSYPGLVRAAILEDPPLHAPQPEDPDPSRLAWSEQARQTCYRQREMTREALIALAHADHPTWPEDELGPWADSKLRVSTAFADSLVQRTGNVTPLEDLAKVTCPVLLVTGDPERGAIITPQQAARAASVLPVLQVAHIAGAGHNVRRENFPEYMKAVKGFLGLIPLNGD